MINWLSKLTRTLRSDRAESSVMQTVTIAVSAILIAAGVVTAPNLINSARDTTVQSQIGNLAFAQTAWIAAKGYVNQNYNPRAGGTDNLGHWKYPYDFSPFAIASVSAPSDCFNNQWMVSVTSKSGKVYWVTSDNAKPVTPDKLVTPISCVAGYVPPADSTPTVPDRISPPTGTPSGLAFSGTTRDFLTWSGLVTCSTGNSPAYQVRTKIATTSYSGAWSSATTQALDFMHDAHKTTGVTTTYNVAAKCRSDDSGDLSAGEVVSTQNFTSVG